MKNMRIATRILASLALLAWSAGCVAYDIPAGCDKTETRAKDFGPECTHARVYAADTDGDGRLSKAELAAYIKAGDYLYDQTSAAVIKAAGSGPHDGDTKPFEAALKTILDQLLDDRSATFALDPAGHEPLNIGDAAVEAQEANRLWRQKYAKLPFTASRKLTDPADPRADPVGGARPVVVAYREDRIRHDSGVQILGTLRSSKPFFAPSGSADAGVWVFDGVKPSLALDVDTFSSTRGRNKSDVVFSLDSTLEYVPEPDGHSFAHFVTISPSYVTDADFGRNQVGLSLGYTLVGGGDFGPGRIHALCKDCPARNIEFTWAPALTITAGEVNDASGNATLLVRQKAGGYIRVSPKLGFKFLTYDRRLSAGFDLVLTRDVEPGPCHSYRETSMQYDLDANIALTAIYRKGDKALTLDPVDAVIFGIGFLF